MNGISFVMENKLITFTLTDNFMDTIIEEKENGKSNGIIILNNLAMVSLAERSPEFCKIMAVQQPDHKLPLKADIFNLKADFYPDMRIVLYQNNYRILTVYDMFKKYYEEILCNIMVNENISNPNEFEKNNIDDLKKQGFKPKHKSILKDGKIITDED